MWIALLLATLARFVNTTDRAADLAKNPLVVANCWELVVSARFGYSHTEHAAFIVLDAGRFTTVEWPASNTLDSAVWVGPFPHGTVAIVHTHPNWLPSPSLLDMRTAARAHVPVYVLTRSRITKTDGERIEIVTDGDWRPHTRAMNSQTSPTPSS